MNKMTWRETIFFWFGVIAAALLLVVLFHTTYKLITGEHEYKQAMCDCACFEGDKE